MRPNRKVLFLLLTIVATGLAALFFLSFTKGSSIPPPFISVLGSAPAGVLDDHDQPESFVTLAITNTPRALVPMFVRIKPKAVQVLASGRWTTVDTPPLEFSLWPGSSREWSIVAPSRWQPLRLTLQYSAGYQANYKYTIWRRLPAGLNRRITPQVSRWIGWPTYAPNGNWTAVTVESPPVPAPENHPEPTPSQDPPDSE